MDTGIIRIEKKALEKYVHQVFYAAGLEDEQAAILARHLVLANLRGEIHMVSAVCPLYQVFKAPTKIIKKFH